MYVSIDLYCIYIGVCIYKDVYVCIISMYVGRERERE